MSELITIKAEQLKWCPYGFEFLDGFHSAERVLSHLENGYVITYDNCSINASEVQVNAKDYEEAVVARIKEMLDGVVERIHKGEWGIRCDVRNGNNGIFYTPIACDPRPSIEKYEIEIK